MLYRCAISCSCVCCARPEEIEGGTELFDPTLAALLVTLVDIFRISSDGAEASVEADVAEDVELREGAEPPVLLSELLDPEADARGAETLLLVFAGAIGTVTDGG